MKINTVMKAMEMRKWKMEATNQGLAWKDLSSLSTATTLNKFVKDSSPIPISNKNLWLCCKQTCLTYTRQSHRTLRYSLDCSLKAPKLMAKKRKVRKMAMMMLSI